MSLSRKHKSMSEAAADLRFVYGPNAAKKIARRFGVAVVTAKLWLAGRTPTAREREIARALLEECSRLEMVVADTKRRWERIADAENSPVARGKAAAARADADRVRIEVKD